MVSVTENSQPQSAKQLAISDALTMNSSLDEHSRQGSSKQGATIDTEIMLCDVCAALLSKLGTEEHHEEETGIESYSNEEFMVRFRCSLCPGLACILNSLHMMWEELRTVSAYVKSNEEGHLLGIWFDAHLANEDEEKQFFSLEVLPLQAESCIVGVEQCVGRLWHPAFLNVNLIRKWLDDCDQNHGVGCRQAVIPRPAHHMLLIDTRRYCLVDSCGIEEYAALSYVWGTPIFLRTVESNIERLRKYGSLLHDEWLDPKVASTVQDAIRLAAALDIAYIWVDSLCIVQDHEPTRNIHLDSMAAIYANAYVTFIAAAGEDASFGIPGVPGGSRQRSLPCCTVSAESGSQFVLSINISSWHDQSKWAERGWTYQEGLFSTRSLLLSNATTWQCSAHELLETTTVKIASRGSLFNARSQTDVHGLNSEHFEEPDYARITVWKQFICDYNPRHLTHDGDVLAAFAGITGVMKSRFPEGFHHGFPVVEEYQMDSLLWRTEGAARRRVVFVPGTAINSLPSWSWIGWQANLTFEAEYAKGPRKPYYSALTLPTRNTESGNQNCRVCTLLPDYCPHLTLSTTTFTLQPYGNIIFHVWGRHRRLTINTNEVRVLFAPEHSEDEQNYFSVLEPPISSGFLLKDIELLAISTYIVSSKGGLDSDTESEVESDAEPTVELCEVLWIGWKDDIAYRRGSGFIRKNIWESWNPKRTTVTIA